MLNCEETLKLGARNETLGLQFAVVLSRFLTERGATEERFDWLSEDPR